jgi:Na+/H+-dicarboxylate symporter
MEFAGFEYGLKPLNISANEPVLVKQSLGDIVKSIFTSNILDSITKSTFLQVIYASIVMGCAAGYLSGKKKEVFDGFIDGIEEIFKRVLKWVTLILPLGSFFIFSYGFSKVTPNIFYFLAPIFVFIFILSISIILILNIFISRKIHVGFWTYLGFLKTPLIITSTTTSVMASMPSFLSSLIQNIKLDEKLVSLFGPLSIAMFRVGSVLYFAVISVYAAQIFSIPLGLWEYGIILLMSVLASFTAVSSGIVNLGLLTIVLGPVGIPSSLIIILFAAIDPLVDPLRCLLNVYVNAFCTTFALHGKFRKEEL